MSAGYPLLEDTVPPDFSGSTGVLGCPDHGFLITKRSGDPAFAPGVPKGEWIQGMSVPFQFNLLKDAYEEYLHKGGVQTVKWIPRMNLTP